MRRIILGKETPYFAAKAQDKLDPAVCLSIESRSVTLDLQADRSSLRDDWAQAFHFCVQDVQFNKVMDMVTGARLTESPLPTPYGSLRRNNRYGRSWGKCAVAKRGSEAEPTPVFDRPVIPFDNTEDVYRFLYTGSEMCRFQMDVRPTLFYVQCSKVRPF